ncbi:hypothetical protein FH972_021687 [Carpinus fangiana]|uniref:Uncharacterized protein n=1 Tax=Carpinus fangiana TaxID=176857 RepID=A0A5N6KQ13_9ROSI|nr:hypothetical protein FH972_021687 [Carpinus fangiana]
MYRSLPACCLRGCNLSCGYPLFQPLAGNGRDETLLDSTAGKPKSAPALIESLSTGRKRQQKLGEKSSRQISHGIMNPSPEETRLVSLQNEIEAIVKDHGYDREQFLAYAAAYWGLVIGDEGGLEHEDAPPYLYPGKQTARTLRETASTWALLNPYFGGVHTMAYFGLVQDLSIGIQMGKINLNDLGTLTQKGFTPLMIAVQQRRDDMLHFLLELSHKTLGDVLPMSVPGLNDADAATSLEKWIDINAQTALGMTSLRLAVDESNLGMVQDLLADTAIDPNIRDYRDETAFYQAVIKNRIHLLPAFFADENVDCNSQSAYGTPLMMACQYGYTEAVELLLDHPDVDAKVRLSPLIFTAASFARYAGHEHLVELLLDYGADSPVVLATPTEAALLDACTTLRCRAAITLLHDTRGAINVNIRAGPDRESPLSALMEGLTFHKFLGGGAEEAVWQDLIELLLQEGAALDVPSMHFWLPLHLAAFKGIEWLARLLVRFGARPDAMGAGEGAKTAVEYAQEAADGQHSDRSILWSRPRDRMADGDDAVLALFRSLEEGTWDMTRARDDDDDAAAIKRKRRKRRPRTRSLP